MADKEKEGKTKLDRQVPRTLKAPLAPPVLRFRVREFVNRWRRKDPAHWPYPLEEKPCWIYVFTVESWGARLHYEARVDGKDKYNLVDWKNKDWAKQNQRSPSKGVDEFVIHGARDSDDYGIYVMISRIQLSRKRIDMYVGNSTANPHGASRVRRRCAKLSLRACKNVDVMGEHLLLYAVEPITIADQAKNQYNRALRSRQQFREKKQDSGSKQLERDLAEAALAVLPVVLKKDSHFVTGGKFKEGAARKVVQDFDARMKGLDKIVEDWGKYLAEDTGSSEYDETIKDFDGDNAQEEERIRIEARHATCKMQSQATREQMRSQLADPNSRITEYMTSEALFTSARKFDNLIAEFGDILGEYGHIVHRVRYIKVPMDFIREGVSKRIGFNFSVYVRYRFVETLKVEVPFIETERLATDPTFRGKLANHAQKFLLIFETINFTLAYDAFRKQESTGSITDYAGIVGAIMDLAGAIGKRAQIILEKQERQLAIDAGKETYKESKKLVIFSRVLVVVGTVGGICDMIEYRSAALDAAKTYNLGQVCGSVVMYMGAALGVHAIFMGVAGLAFAGPAGWIALALVVIGSLIVWYFTESELETWLRTCQWGRDYLGQTHAAQLEKLNRLLAMFSVELKYENLKSGGFGTYFSTNLKVTVVPGFVSAKSKFRVITETQETTGSGIFTKLEYHKADERVLPAKMDSKGKAEPLPFMVDLSKSGGFRQQIRIKSQLDLLGDGKVMIPKQPYAWWAFFFDHNNKAFRQTNSGFKID